MRELIILLAALSLSACAGTTTSPGTAPDPQNMASADSVPDDFDIGDIPDYLAYLQQLHKEMVAGELGTFKQSDMKLFAESTQTLNKALSGVNEIDELSTDDKIEVYNAQEAVNAVLAHNVENRPICRRQHTVGTHMRVMVCSTAAQQEVMRDRAREAFEYVQGQTAITRIDPTVR